MMTKAFPERRKAQSVESSMQTQTGKDGTNPPAILDLGCGTAKTPGALGVDIDASCDPDLVHDLNEVPCPLLADSFRQIVCSHIVEHIDDPVLFFDELYRLAAPGCRIRILTPHFTNRCSYADPSHKHHFSVQFADFFAERPDKAGDIGPLGKPARFLFEHRFDHPTQFNPPRFRILSQHISFSRIFRWTGVERFANRFYRFWEFYLCFVLPARDISLELEVLKRP